MTGTLRNRKPHSQSRVALSAKGRWNAYRRKLGRSLLHASLLSVVALSGCQYHQNWWKNGRKVGPNYCKPAAPVADSWIDFNDPRVIADPANDREWWRVFNDPALDMLVDSTFRGNLPLREQGQRVMEYRALRAVRVGERMPQGSVGGFYDRLQISNAGNLSGVPNPKRSFDLTNVGANLEWELDVWGKFRRRIEQADADVERQVELYDDILSIAVADTATAYTNLRAAQNFVRLARENVEYQKGSLRLAEARYREGATGEMDVTLAKSVLEETEALIPQFQAELRKASNELCVLVGTPPQDLAPQVGDGPIPMADTSVALGIPGELLRRRPDIRAAERSVAAASAEIGVAAAELYPHFAIGGGFGWTANNASDLFSGDSFGGIVGPSFRWDILNFGRIQSNVVRHEARFQEAAIRYQQTVLTANKEVENALVEFLKSQERADRLEEAVKASKRSVELAMIQYKEGAISFDRIYVLQNVLVRQELDFAESEAKISLSLIDIYRALRGGWQIRLDGFNNPSMMTETVIMDPAPAEVDEVDLGTGE
jgi:NodT family efflux transporter outer membrane factor (OMF) lipoprotein